MNAPHDNPQLRLEPEPGVLPPPRGRRKRPVTPYLDARREWNAQFGSQAAAMRAWRYMALIAGLVALVAIVGLVTLGARTQVVPYVVVLDDAGRAVSHGAGVSTSADDPRIARALIARFIRNFRLVTSDGAAQKKAIFELFALLSRNDPAYTVVANHLKGDGDPFQRAKQSTVSIELSALLAVSDRSYQIEWREIERDLHGAEVGRADFQGRVTVRRQKDVETSTLLDNPIGLYITDFTWTKRL